jgi:hypothetical protein
MKLRTATCLLALLAAGCLEQEETITVHPDGSLEVTLLAKGDTTDLCTGYPLPLASPWKPVNKEARDWLAEMAPDTGGPQAQERLVELRAVERDGEKVPGRQLIVGANFASTDDLPRWFAPDEEPYRSAYLARSADLELEQKGRRTVYTFERAYHGRRYAPWDVTERARNKLHPDLMKKMESGFEFADEEWPEVAQVLEEAFVGAGRAFVRSAFSSIYTEGDASVPPAALRRALQQVDGSLRTIGSRAAIDNVRNLIEQLRLAEQGSRDREAIEKQLGAQLETFERDGRAAMREAIEVALEEAGVEGRIRNAVRARLEWAFTSFDHTGDLSDEKFTLRVRMPGVIIDGNFDEVDGEVAVWSFEGRDLRDADRRMHVVSVL